MMIISTSGTKRRHAVVWFLFAMVVVGVAPLAILTANFPWPPRKRVGASDS
jgi:hypothetical protein